MRAQGFQVWLRPHTRIDISDIFPASNMAAAGVRLLKTDCPLVEPVILRNRELISAVVSVYSSFLVHSHSLFGIPAFTVPATLSDTDQANWKALQDEVVPDISLMLGAKPENIATAARSFSNDLLCG